MATNTAAPRSIRDFPGVAAAQQRLDDLNAKFNLAREQLVQITAGAPKPASVRDEDHVAELLAGKDPDAIDLEEVREYSRRVQEAEKTVALLRRAIEKQEQIVNETRGEASAQILRDRRPEFRARARAIVLAALRLLEAHQGDQAFRFALGQEGVTGAETVWQLPTWIVHQFGSVQEADSAIVRILREAEALGVLTSAEVARIRTGGAIPEA